MQRTLYCDMETLGRKEWRGEGGARFLEEEGYKMGPERKHQQKEPSKRRQKLTGVRGKQELKYRGSAGVTLRGPDVIPDPGSCGPFPEKLPWAPVCVMELVRTNQASVCHWDS